MAATRRGRLLQRLVGRRTLQIDGSLQLGPLAVSCGPIERAVYGVASRSAPFWQGQSSAPVSIRRLDIQGWLSVELYGKALVLRSVVRNCQRPTVLELQ